MALPGTRRFAHRAGVGLLILAVCLPFAALLFPLIGLPSVASNVIVSLFVAGVPEVLCLAAIAILGKEGVPRFTSVPASKLRYYGALISCLLNGLPISLYAYAPQWMPGGPAKYFILVSADLVFVFSVLLMGNEFWEKFRRLFIWKGQNAVDQH